jgi:hypothetical protein
MLPNLHLQLHAEPEESTATSANIAEAAVYSTQQVYSFLQGPQLLLSYAECCNPSQLCRQSAEHPNSSKHMLPGD